MKTLYIFASVTTAQRAKRFFDQNGWNAKMGRAPAGLYDMGCSHMLECQGREDGEKRLRALNSADLNCRAAFYKDDAGYIQFYKREGRR